MSNTGGNGGYSVLCVDDEEHSLKYFRKICRRSFSILTAGTGEEALSIIAERGNEIGVVMTDQRMPGKKGVDVLRSVRESHPGIVRILTTAYSDLDSAIDAVNNGAIHKYVVKPWDIRDLESLLKWAMDFFVVQKERNTLLNERMALLRYFVVADRVQSFAALAAGLAHHIRNSMVALKTFLDLFPAATESSLGSGNEKLHLAKQFWQLASDDSKRIVEMTQMVADATVEPCYDFSRELAVSAILEGAVRAATDVIRERYIEVDIDVADDVETHRIDNDMPKRLFGILLRRTCQLSPQGSTIDVVATGGAEIRGAPGTRILIRGHGDDWSKEEVSSFFTAFAPSATDPRDLGLDLLSAFFMCYHHGGELQVNPRGPDGPGFEVLLPLDPEAVERLPLEADYLEGLLTKHGNDAGGDELR